MGCGGELLIDEPILTVAPTLIGNGIPLFKEGDYQLDLSFEGTRNFNQFVELIIRLTNKKIFLNKLALIEEVFEEKYKK